MAKLGSLKELKGLSRQLDPLGMTPRRLWLGPSWLAEDTETVLRTALQRSGGKLFSNQLYRLYCKHPWLKSCIGSLEKYVARSSAFIYYKRTDSERPYIVLGHEEASPESDEYEDKPSLQVGKGERQLLRRYVQRQFRRDETMCLQELKGLSRQLHSQRGCLDSFTKIVSPSGRGMSQVLGGVDSATPTRLLTQVIFRNCSVVVSGGENVTCKTSPLKWWQKLDIEFGKAWLDYMQKGVLAAGYKHPLKKPRRSDVQKERVPRRRRLDSTAGEEGLLDHVKQAYGAKRAQQAQRCRRALQRSQAVVKVCHEVDMDAKMARQLHLEESRAFVANLDPWNHGVKGKTNRGKPRSGASFQSTGASASDCISTGERNFRKTCRSRRNGLSLTGTERIRVRCEKTRLLQHEKDAAERNAWHLSEALRGMTPGERDKIYIMSTAAARNHISMSFP